MATTLPIKILMGALPAKVKWKIQQLADAMVERMSLVTSGTFALFAAGSTEPSSDVGPWFKDNNTWMYFSYVTGDYQPIIIAQESLGYFIGSATPDQNIYQFWIETTAGGSPLAVKIYYSGAWVDVYAAALVPYLTTAAFNAAIASYSTTAQMTAAIAAAVGGGAFSAYPAQGTNVAPQSILADGANVQAVINSAPINPAPAPFNTGTYRYVAPAAGNYMVSVTTQFDNNGGAAATMEINMILYKNGGATGIGDQDGTPSPNGSRWSPGFTAMIALAATDFLELFVSVGDGVGAGNVDLTTLTFNVWRVSG